MWGEVSDTRTESIIFTSRNQNWMKIGLMMNTSIVYPMLNCEKVQSTRKQQVCTFFYTLTLSKVKMSKIGILFRMLIVSNIIRDKQISTVLKIKLGDNPCSTSCKPVPSLAESLHNNWAPRARKLQPMQAQRGSFTAEFRRLLTALMVYIAASRLLMLIP